MFAEWFPPFAGLTLQLIELYVCGIFNAGYCGCRRQELTAPVGATPEKGITKSGVAVVFYKIYSQ